LTKALPLSFAASLKGFTKLTSLFLIVSKTSLSVIGSRKALCFMFFSNM